MFHLPPASSPPLARPSTGRSRMPTRADAPARPRHAGSGSVPDTLAKETVPEHRQTLHTQLKRKPIHLWGPGPLASEAMDSYCSFSFSSLLLPAKPRPFLLVTADLTRLSARRRATKGVLETQIVTTDCVCVAHLGSLRWSVPMIPPNCNRSKRMRSCLTYTRFSKATLVN